MNDWNPSDPAVQEAEDFGNVPPEEAYDDKDIPCKKKHTHTKRCLQ